MSVPIGPQRPLYDPTRDAEGYVSLLWGHIVTRILALIHPHHYQHEPGGQDFIEMPLGGLKDVLIYSPSAGNVLTYSASGTVPIWRNMPGGGGSGIGQAFFEMYGFVSVATVPGPTNLTGSSLTITRVRIESDGECAGIAAGQSFNFSAGGGSSDNEELSTEWTDGSGISAAISSVGTDATYLTVDVAFAS